jgi:hypothetical protein
VDTLTLEGTWEEILQHTATLTGQRVRVIILPSPTPTPAADSLAHRLHNRVGQVCFSPADLSEKAGTAFADILVDQHNTLGNNL